jgi:hypothetical protein
MAAILSAAIKVGTTKAANAVAALTMAPSQGKPRATLSPPTSALGISCRRPITSDQQTIAIRLKVSVERRPVGRVGIAFGSGDQCQHGPAQRFGAADLGIDFDLVERLGDELDGRVGIDRLFVS